MKTTRLVTKQECDWLQADIPAGTEIFECKLNTYGCVNYDQGIAATFDTEGGYPFFEFPLDAI